MTLSVSATPAYPQAPGAHMPEHYPVAMAHAVLPSARLHWHVPRLVPSLKRARRDGGEEPLRKRARGPRPELPRTGRKRSRTPCSDVEDDELGAKKACVPEPFAVVAEAVSGEYCRALVPWYPRGDV